MITVFYGPNYLQILVSFFTVLLIIASLIWCYWMSASWRSHIIPDLIWFVSWHVFLMFLSRFTTFCGRDVCLLGLLFSWRLPRSFLSEFLLFMDLESDGNDACSVGIPSVPRGRINHSNLVRRWTIRLRRHWSFIFFMWRSTNCINGFIRACSLPFAVNWNPWTVWFCLFIHDTYQERVQRPCWTTLINASFTRCKIRAFIAFFSDVYIACITSVTVFLTLFKHDCLIIMAFPSWFCHLLLQAHRVAWKCIHKSLHLVREFHIVFEFLAFVVVIVFDHWQRQITVAWQGLLL